MAETEHTSARAENQAHTQPRGKRVERICQEKSCGRRFQARVADVRRGWARFCSKSCKAIHQERRTGQHAAFKARDQLGMGDFEDGEAEDGGWDAHKEQL